MSHNAEIGTVASRLERSSGSTASLCDRRKERPEYSPIFRMNYFDSNRAKSRRSRETARNQAAHNPKKILI